MRGRARPHTAMALSSASRRPLSGPGIKAAPPSDAHGMEHASRPPTRQKPPPLSLLAQHRDEFNPLPAQHGGVASPVKYGGGVPQGLDSARAASRPGSGLGVSGPVGGRSGWSRNGMGTGGGMGSLGETMPVPEEEEGEEGEDPFGGGPGPNDGGADSDE